MKKFFLVIALLILSPKSFALTSSQLSACVKAEAKTLRSRSLLNMSDLEKKVLNDPSSLRTFVDDSASAASKDANPIARKLMSESATCADLADKWAVKTEEPRPTVDQLVEIFKERGATVQGKDIQDRILKPALANLNPKLSEGFSLEKNPGVAMLAAMYLTPDGTVQFPSSAKIPARERKVAEQIKKAQSIDEAEQVIVNDTKTALADDLEKKLTLALKKL